MAAKYGAITLSQSRLHVGSGARLQRVISRALKGHPVTISVIGGSGGCNISTLLLAWLFISRFKW
jgi:hypothetical protein